MPSDTIKSLLRELYLTSGDYGGVEPELNDIMNYYGEEDPDFIGSLRQEGTDLMRRKRNPNRALTSPASSDVLGSTEPFGFDEAMDEFQSNPRGVMDNYAAVNLAPDGKGGGLANLPLEKGSFSSQLANVAEALPVVGPMFDPMFRTENESRALEDRNQVLDFTKTASEAFPIAAGAAAAGGAVGLGVVGSAALGGGVADVMLGGAPFVDGMTPEQNKQRLLSIGISTATGGIGGKASQYINKWAGNRALEAFKKLAIPGKATDDLIESASKKTLDPMALASALTGGRVEGIAPHIQAAAKIAGQKSLTNASKSVLGNEIKEIATSALRKDFAIDLALGAGQAEVTAQATEGRHATGMELGMGLAVSGAVHGARGAGESSAMKKVQSQILGGMKETAPVKAAPKPVDPATQTQAEADAQAAFKTTTEVKPTAKAPTVDYSKFPSAGEAARAAHHEVMKAGGSEADAEKARKRAAARYKAWENTLPEAEKAARVKARDDAKKAPKVKKPVDDLPVSKEEVANAKKIVDESTTIPPEIKEELKVAIDKAAAESTAEPPDSPMSDWLKHNMALHFDTAKRLGIVEKVEELSAQRKTAQEVVNSLSTELKDVAATDRKTLVQVVRSKLGIPSMDSKTEFETWLTGRNTPKPAEKLAEPLKGGKPRYSYGNRQFDVEFLDDVDKAAYIVAQSKKSKKNDEYLKFVMDSLGMTDQEAISYGIDVKSRIKKAAEEAITSLSKDTVLRVGKVAASMPKAEAPVNFDDPPFEKFNDEPSPQGETNEYRNPDGSFKFPVPDFLKTETAPQGETNEYRNPDGSFKFPVPDFLKTETAPKAEELTLDRINERAFDEQYDEKGVLEQQPDIRKGLPTSEDLSLKHLERMMVDSEYAYDPSEFEIPDLKKNLIDEYVAEAEDDLIFSDTIDEWKAQIAKRAELRKFSKDPEGDYKADSDMFTRLAGLIGQERAAATNDVMRSEVQEKIDFLMKEAQKSRDDFLLKQEKLRPSSARETVKEVEQPKLSEEQSAANVAHGLRLMFEKYKRPELESLADEYLELAGGTSKTVNDADAIEAANKFLSNYRKSKVSERIASGNKEESRTVRAKDDEEAKERRRLLMDDVEKAEGKRREKPLTAPSEKEEYRKMAEAEGRLQPKKAKTGLSKKQLKAEADKLLAEAENPGEVKLEAEAPKRDRIAEMKAAQERLKAGVKDEPPVPEEVKSVEGVDVVKQMEDLQDRIDNLDEAEFGDEWKDNRRREIEELLRRGKSKKKDIQESITDEEREFLDSYHEAEGEFKDELKAENKERDSGDKMDKEERAELLAEKLDEWLDEHIDNEAGERSSEAAETLQAEMDRLQQIRDNPKRPPTDTEYQFRLDVEDPYKGSPYRSRFWDAMQKFKPDLKFGSIAEAKRAILGRGDVSQAEIDRTFAAMTGVEKPTVRDILEAFVRDNLVIQEVEGDFDTYGDSVSTPGTTNRRMINFRLPLEANNFASHYAPNNKQYKVFGNVRASAEAPDLGSADRYPESRTAFHVRISDMDLGDGRKALVIEEIQSDAAEHLVKGEGPDFPLSDPASRNRIAIERMISLAIERGYDSIVMAPPAEQSRRNQSLGLDTYKYRGVRRGTDKYYRLVAEWKAAKAEYKGKYEGRHPEKAGDSAYRRAYNAEQELSDYIHSAGPGENPSEVFVDLYGKSRAAVRELPPELKARIDALKPGEEYTFTDKEVGTGSDKAVAANYEKVIFPTFESILKKFGMKPLNKKELTSRFSHDATGGMSIDEWDKVGPLILNAESGHVDAPDVDSPSFRAAKELYDRMQKNRELSDEDLETPEIEAADRAYRTALRKMWDIQIENEVDGYAQLIGKKAKQAGPELKARIEKLLPSALNVKSGFAIEGFTDEAIGNVVIHQHLDSFVAPNEFKLGQEINRLDKVHSDLVAERRETAKPTGRITSVSLEQKMPYIGGDITPEVKAKFQKHRVHLLRMDGAPEFAEARAAVERASNDAVFSAKGEKAMADHIDQAVKSGKVSKDIGDGLIQVIKKYGKNLKHVSLAFSDDLPAGVKGAFKPAKDTIMLSAERMTHEGVAAGLEELFHGMEKVIDPSARVEVKKAYEAEMKQEILGLGEALAWARKNNRTEMASDIQGTLTWLAKSAKGQAEGLPPIRDYYKFSDASEYFADRMMNYEWDRLSGFTHPDDSSLVGRASKWFRGLANEITDTFEAKWGEDRLKREWLKLGRMEQRVQGDNKSLAQAVWFDDQSQTRKWADDFLLRPGDGLFSVKQQSLAPDVEAAMLRTTPSSVKPKSLTTRLSETHGFDPSNQARFMTRLVTKLFDEFHWLKKWEDTASTWFSAEGGVQRGLDPADSGLARMRTAAQSNALVEHTLTDGQLRFDPEDGTFHPKEGRALKQIWGDAYKAGVEPQFKAFLYASRVEETSSKKGVSSGWKQEEIDAAKAYGKTEVAPGKTIESLANEVHDWMRSFLDIAEAAGIIDPSARAGWEEANYIPFLLEKSLARPFEQSGGYGAFAENSKAVSFDNQNFFDQAGGMANLNAALTKADPDIYQRKDFKEGMYHQDVMEGLVRMSKHLLQMSVKNSAARKTLENFTNPDYGDISTKRYSAEEYEKLKNKGGKKFLTALEGGKTVYFEVVDPELYNMMTNFGADKYKRFSQHPVIKALFVTPSRLFSSFITRAPEFLGVNPLRDSMALWATGTAGDATSSRDAFVDAVANIGKNYRDMGRTFYDFFGNEVTKLTRDPELMAMSAAGLAGAGYYGTEAGDIARNIGGEIRSESSKFRTINPVEWYRWMGKVAAVGELRTRRTKYDQVMKAGGTHAEAVQRSLDLINYSNRGSSELLGFFLDTVPFLKARMSGLYKLGRTLSTLPHADKSKRQRILAASVFHRTAIMAIASSLMYMYNMTENKDRYESLDENQRDAYWHMWLGDYHVQIPKPFEIGALAGALPERAADLLTGKGTMGDFGDFMMRTLINNFQLAQLPHTLVPIKEQLENKVGYTQRPIVSAAQEEVEPEAQYTASTSETAKQLADLAPDNAPDWMRSPSRIQHLLDSYFATMGEYAVFATDSMLRAAGKTSNPPAEHTDRLPGLNAVGRLVRKEPADRPRSTKYVASYYDFQRKLDRMNNTIMNYRKLGKYKKADDLQKKFQEDAATYYKGRGLSQYLSAISQQQRRVFESDTMTPDQKRKEIDRLRIQSNKAIETFEKERRKNK